LADLTALEATGTIFAALDQVAPTALSTADEVRTQLLAAHSGAPVLNSATGSLRRYALLRRLYEIGWNRFNVVRGTDDPGALRYPVFIRYEHRHNGNLTPLLHDRRALDRALGQLVVRGASVAELLIVEFCETAGTDGLYRKYSAMRIGERILPRHLHASASWMAKSQTSDGDERLVREELDYLNDHPHAKWLSDVFELAQIEYGRIDYGLFRGQPQVWEINTNPTLGRGEGRRRTARDSTRQLREPGRVIAHRLMIDAFKALERPDPSASLPIAISEPVRRRLRSEAAARRQLGARRGLGRRVVGNPIVQALKGAIRPVVACIAPAVARLVRHRA
jgi:hypothetical protein